MEPFEQSSGRDKLALAARTADTPVVVPWHCGSKARKASRYVANLPVEDSSVRVGHCVFLLDRVLLWIERAALPVAVGFRGGVRSVATGEPPFYSGQCIATRAPFKKKSPRGTAGGWELEGFKMGPGCG